MLLLIILLKRTHKHKYLNPWYSYTTFYCKEKKRRTLHPPPRFLNWPRNPGWSDWSCTAVCSSAWQICLQLTETDDTIIDSLLFFSLSLSIYIFKLGDQLHIFKVCKGKIDLFLLPVIFILHGMLKPVTAKTRLSSFNLVHTLPWK